MKLAAIRESDFPLWRCGAAGIAALAGLTSTLFGDSHLAFLVAIAATSALGVAGILFCVTKPSAASVWEVYAYVLCIGYGFGTLQTFVGGYLVQFDPFARADASAPALSTAISLVLLLVCLLLACGLLDRKSLLGDTRIPSSQHALVLGLGVLVSLTALGMVAAGRIRFHGDVSADADVGVRLSAMASLVSQALCPIGAVGLYCARSSSARLRIIFFVLAAIDLMVLVSQSRRILLFSLLIFIMAYAAGGKALRIVSLRAVITSVLIMLALVIGNRFYYAMRLAQDENPNARDVTSLVVRAGEIFIDPEASDLDAKIKANLAERAFILDYLAELVERLDHVEPMHGAVFGHAVVTAAPEALYPWKYKYMYGMEEELVHPHFGMPVWDAANTVLTAGVSDFSVAGLLIYPVATLLCCRLLLRLAQFGGPVVHAALCFALVNVLLNVENQLPGILAGARDAILLAIVVLLASMVFGQLRSMAIVAPRTA